jgi:hypothetical protein
MTTVINLIMYQCVWRVNINNVYNVYLSRIPPRCALGTSWLPVKSPASISSSYIRLYSPPRLRPRHSLILSRRCRRGARTSHL